MSEFQLLYRPQSPSWTWHNVLVACNEGAWLFPRRDCKVILNRLEFDGAVKIVFHPIIPMYSVKDYETYPVSVGRVEFDDSCFWLRGICKRNGFWMKVI